MPDWADRLLEIITNVAVFAIAAFLVALVVGAATGYVVLKTG